MQDFETIIIKENINTIHIIFNREEYKNSINTMLLNELNTVLDLIEKNSEYKIIILEGKNGFFCTGMDFNELIQTDVEKTMSDGKSKLASLYMTTLKRLSRIGKVVISKIEGQVLAGGMGLAAVSDLVIATPDSQFSLSEALWGLLPAMVIPFLVRRTGFQTAYKLTLTTIPISAGEAQRVNLVDDVSDNLELTIKRSIPRLARIESSTVENIKRYFKNIVNVDEDTEEKAVKEISRLMSDPKIRNNIENYVNYGKFPWE